MNKIPFSDLGAQYQELKKEIDRAIQSTIKKGDFILGEEVKKFENDFSKLCNTTYALGVSSGTSAIFLALLSLGVTKGDEVIVPGFTYIATANAVSYTGAKPVFVDIDRHTYNIDLEKIKKAITKNTKAIIPVHLYGQPVNMSEILKIAKQYNLKVIEDAAQAHGARVMMEDKKWHVVGGLGNIGCFSFYPSKNLGGMGDGGMVVTNNKELYDKLHMLRDCGRISKYEHAIIGYNSRLDTLQAAILRVKLKRLHAWNKLRSQAAGIYNEFLKEIESIITPVVAPFAEHVYHVYVIRTKARNKLAEFLKNKNIGVIIHYPLPLHLQKAYQGLGYRKGDLSVAEEVSGDIISLPMYPHLKKAQIKFITDTIKQFVRSIKI